MRGKYYPMLRYLPNFLTLMRFPLTGLFLYGSFQPSHAWRFAATLFFLLSMITDLLDGIIARRWDAVSRMGVFLDPLADKVLVLSGFFVLLIRPDLHWGRWEPWVLASVAVIALREVAITVLRSWKVRSSRPLVTTIWGKAKTTTQMLTLIVGLLLLNALDILKTNIPFVLDVIALGILASAVLAAISATDYFRTAMHSSSEPSTHHG